MTELSKTLVIGALSIGLFCALILGVGVIAAVIIQHFGLV
jgi:hypothetical protein